MVQWSSPLHTLFLRHAYDVYFPRFSFIVTWCVISQWFNVWYLQFPLFQNHLCVMYPLLPPSKSEAENISHSLLPPFFYLPLAEIQPAPTMFLQDRRTFWISGSLKCGFAIKRINWSTILALLLSFPPGRMSQLGSCQSCLRILFAGSFHPKKQLNF